MVSPTLTQPIYGAAPKDLGQIDLDTSEMMFWLYLPIKMPGQVEETLPPQLEKFRNIVMAVFGDTYDTKRWTRSYVYLSVKVLHVTPDAPGNRPGWHSDGFMTDDLNYIWCDRNPTEFYIRNGLMKTYADHAKSMGHFESHIPWSVERGEGRLEHGKVNHLYRLDQSVIHRVSLNVDTGKRAFIKVSVSDRPYVQLGNSINHELPEHPLPTLERMAERNCPQGNQ